MQWSENCKNTTAVKHFEHDTRTMTNSQQRQREGGDLQPHRSLSWPLTSLSISISMHLLAEMQLAPASLPSSYFLPMLTWQDNVVPG